MKRRKNLLVLLFVFLVSALVACTTTQVESNKDSDSSLASIKINGETMTDFNPQVTNYEWEITYASTIEVEGTPSSSKAVVDGNTIITVNPEKMNYEVTLTCIAEDQSTTAYNLKLTLKELSSDNSLTALMIDGSLLVGFNSEVLNYTYELKASKEVTISVITSSASAKATGTGTILAEAGQIAKVEVTAEDGSVRVYQIAFIAKEGEVVKPYLTNILIDNVSLAGFTEETLNYTYQLQDKLTCNIFAVAADSKYEITGLGDYEVSKGGSLTVTITVKNQNLSTTYTIVLQAPALDSDNTLKELKLNGDAISLTNSIFSYSYDLYDTKTLTISAVANSNKAKIDGLGTFTLSSNEATYTIKVIAEDGSVQNYVVKVSYKETTSQTAIDYYAGLSESIALTYTGSTNLTISYRQSTSGSWQTVDQELVRLVGDKVRVDIVGLAAGTYEVKVGNETLSNIEVYPYDRSGYAFFNVEEGVGAYNLDGTLKADTQIIYVSNATKNTVTAKINGKTYTGLVAILQNVKNSKTPVVVRILDSITTNQWAVKDDAPRLVDGSNYTSAELEAYRTNTYETTYGENLVGLVSKIMISGDKTYTYTTTKTGVELTKTDSRGVDETTYTRDKYPSITGKKVHDDDSYNNMLDISDAKNLTIEGIGTSAEIFQFGFTFKKCNSVEVRNLTFTKTTEDACSFEGSNGSEEDYGNYFIHHNTFNKGQNNWDISGERDKAEGDGSMDLKYLHNVTASYNVFNNCHKTSLVGGSDSNIQYNITYHHNYYNQVSSRLPLGRQANLHIYNNYFYKVSSSSVDLRAGAYAFLEGNYFEDSKLPRVRSEKDESYNLASIKSYNDYVDSKSEEPSSSYGKWQVVTSRTASVISNCQIKGVNYSNFDTNSTLFYYDANKKQSAVMVLTTAEEAKADVLAYAGVLKEGQTKTIFS